MTKKAATAVSSAPNQAIAIEKLGGFAAFGSANLKSRGEVDWSSLSPADQAAVDTLFKRKRPPARDASTPEERYMLTRMTPRGEKTVTVTFTDTPAALRASVKDELG